MYRFGFIGAGHMGATLADAVARFAGGENVAVCDRDETKSRRLAAESGCAVLTAAEIAATCRYIFLGVRPQDMAGLLTELRPALRARKDFVLVSMAAGIRMARLLELLGFPAPVLRIMPNTPAAVGAGCMLYAAGEGLADADREAILAALRITGATVALREELIDAGSAISGCGPAFVYQFILGLAQAGEALGLSEETALALSERTVLGAAQLAATGGTPPQALRDQVCSPGGATIEGVKRLGDGFFGQIADAVRASYARTVEMGTRGDEAKN